MVSASPKAACPLFLCVCLCVLLSLMVSKTMPLAHAFLWRLSGTVTGWCGRHLDQVHPCVLQSHHPGRGQRYTRLVTGQTGRLQRLDAEQLPAPPLLLREATVALTAHIFPGCGHKWGVLGPRQRNSSALQMALKMGPWGFHLADTLCPGPGLIPRGVPQPLQASCVSHHHPHQSPDRTEVAAQPRIPHHTLSHAGRGRRQGQWQQDCGVTQHQHQTLVTDPLGHAVGQALHEPSRGFPGDLPVISSQRTFHV